MGRITQCSRNPVAVDSPFISHLLLGEELLESREVEMAQALMPQLRQVGVCNVDRAILALPAPCRRLRSLGHSELEQLVGHLAGPCDHLAASPNGAIAVEEAHLKAGLRQAGYGQQV